MYERSNEEHNENAIVQVIITHGSDVGHSVLGQSQSHPLGRLAECRQTAPKRLPGSIVRRIPKMGQHAQFVAEPGFGLHRLV